MVDSCLRVRQKGIILRTTVLVVFLMSVLVNSFAGEQLPFNEDLKGKIQEKFMVQNEVSQIKLSSYRSEILERKEEIAQNLKNYLRHYKGKKKSKVKRLLNDI